MATDTEPATPLPPESSEPQKAPRKRREVSFSERIASFRYIRSFSFAPPRDPALEKAQEEEDAKEIAAIDAADLTAGTPSDPPAPPKSAMEHWLYMKSLFTWENDAEKKKAVAQTDDSASPVSDPAAIKEDSSPPSDHWAILKNAMQATSAFLSAKKGAETSEAGAPSSDDTSSEKPANPQQDTEEKPSVDHWANIRTALLAAMPFQEKSPNDPTKAPVPPSVSLSGDPQSPQTAASSASANGEAAETNEKPPSTPMESTPMEGIGLMIDNAKQSVFRRMSSVRKVMLGSTLGTPHADWESNKGPDVALDGLRKDLVKAEPGQA
eukprot:TRINITY_DN2196_c2_g1_i1.p1 TRINITY_DN2196_c2_g1~~TRINITY_DN2196_c2_g1_i1.p1  ORF type:complete len:324 (+),score=72.17 TRINITY_DN2196_c2_g1_i1:183-1154(+)